MGRKRVATSEEKDTEYKEQFVPTCHMRAHNALSSGAGNNIEVHKTEYERQILDDISKRASEI